MNKKQEAYVAIVWVEGESVEDGADGPVRDAITKAMNDVGLKVTRLSSGFGMSPEDAEIINRMTVLMPAKIVIPRRSLK